MTKRILSLCALAAGATVLASSAIAGQSLTLHATGTPPMPPPSSFSTRVDNQWFPLLPGTQWVYTGMKDGKRSRDFVVVTHKTRTIEGVPCVAVRDRLYLRGRLEERTTDWYSQDSHDNVWYFGENTAELNGHGHVKSTEGTWTAGVHGAKPGIHIPGHPRLGQSAPQEFYKGHAEDHFRVIGLFRTVVGGRQTNTLLTKEWTPLEPGVLDHKMYVRGTGTVLEQSQKGANERNELVAVTR